MPASLQPIYKKCYNSSVSGGKKHHSLSMLRQQYYVSVTKNQLLPDRGLILSSYPVIDCMLGMTEDVVRMMQPEDIPQAEDADGVFPGRIAVRLLPSLGVPLPNENEPIRHGDGNTLVVVNTQCYEVNRANHPQVARILRLMGFMHVKTGLMHPERRRDNFRLARAHLEHARSLLYPFVTQEPGHRIGSQVLLHLPDEVQVVTPRRNRHQERITADFASVLSLLGRIALVESDGMDTRSLEAAHQWFVHSGDVVGRLRNAFYLLLAEQSRRTSWLAVGRQLGRVGWALALARRNHVDFRKARGIVGAMASHVQSFDRANYGLTDWNAL
jgi:hypothetical protein